jgi:hypothetical protein
MLRGFFVKAISVFMILVLFSGCVSSTMMTVYVTEPNGRPVNEATVLVNGENIGQTPNASTKVSNFISANTEITVSKEGYYTVKTEAVKEEKVTNIVIGLLLNIWAFLWVYGPKTQQNVIIRPEVVE